MKRLIFAAGLCLITRTALVAAQQTSAPAAAKPEIETQESPALDGL